MFVMVLKSNARDSNIKIEDNNFTRLSVNEQDTSPSSYCFGICRPRKAVSFFLIHLKRLFATDKAIILCCLKYMLWGIQPVGRLCLYLK